MYPVGLIKINAVDDIFCIVHRHLEIISSTILCAWN